MYINADWAGEAVGWLQRHKVKTQPLLDRLGVHQRDLEFGRQVSIRHFAAILEFGASNVGDDHFGLHRGTEFEIKKGGLLSYLAATSETVNDAILHYQRYASVVCDGFALELERDSDGVELVLHVSDPCWPVCRHLGEFVAARLIGALRVITGVELRPVAISFLHPDGSSAARCRQVFNCAVKYGARADILKLSVRTVQIPIPTADSRLGYMLRQYAEGLLRQAHGKSDGSLEEQVLKVISRRLSSGDVSLGAVAAELKLGERTLRRRLQEAQLKFSDLVTRARLRSAEDWLTQTNFDLKHISFLLGYSEPAAFTRAYKRWTGRAPSRTRMS